MHSLLKTAAALACLVCLSTPARAGLLTSLLSTTGPTILQDNSTSAAFDSTGAPLSATTPLGVGDIVTGVLRITQSNTGGAPTLDANQQLVILFSAKIIQKTVSGGAGGTTLYDLGPVPASAGTGKSIQELLTSGVSQFPKLTNGVNTFSDNTIFALLESQPNPVNPTAVSLTTDLAAFKSASQYKLDLTGGLIANTDFFQATLKNLGSATGPTPGKLLGLGTAGYLNGITNIGSDSGGFTMILNPLGLTIAHNVITTQEDGVTEVSAQIGFTAALIRADPTAFNNGYQIRDQTFIAVNTSPAAVPEPGSLILFSVGLAGMGAAALRRRKKPAVA
jgi:hypothetical protein